MILVIIIVVAWMIILAPNLLKRRARTVGGINSISHFHHQLRILEQSGPQSLETPAFRIRSVDGSPSGGDGAPVAPKLAVVGADQLPRPALAFLGRDPSGADDAPSYGVPAGPGHGQGYGPGYGPAYGSGYGSGSDPRDTGSGPLGASPRPPYVDARHRARRRRRDTLGVLTMLFATTLLIGFIPGATVAWALSLVSGLALAAYVFLLVRMRQMAEERERKLHYLRPGAGHRGFDEVEAGYPGEGGAVPEGVTELPVRISGRYAHPSNQAALAR